MITSHTCDLCLDNHKATGNSRILLGKYYNHLFVVSVKCICIEMFTVCRYLKCDMYDYNLSDLGQRFDVIYIDPPLEEYQRRVSGINFSQKPWGFEEVSFEKLSIHVYLDRVLYIQR